MPAAISAARLKNTAAAAAFARRLNLPSGAWDDVWREAHDKAFTIAGTLGESGEKALEQIREAVRAAIENGETIEDFRKRFDDIVAKTGWDYRGGRHFRTRAIFETNLRTSWAAGRFSQMQEIKAARPFWQYRHGGSAVPRPEHLAWDGLILHADHPWWRTHYPPNGFGCTCHVVTLDAEGVNRAWKKAGGQGNAPELSAHSPGIVLARGSRGEKSKPRLWTPPDPQKDLVEVKVKGRGLVQVPRGIDPGWDYVPGSADFEAQKREELKRRAKAEQKRRAFLAELDAALDSALAELKAIEADARIEVQKLGAPESVAREVLTALEKLFAEAIADARKAHANAKKGAEKIEFNEADERKAELVAVLRRLVDLARKSASEHVSRVSDETIGEALGAMREVEGMLKKSATAPRGAQLRLRQELERLADPSTPEKERRPEVVRAVIDHLDLDALGFSVEQQAAPSAFQLPEDAIDPLNERLRREGRPFEIFGRPEKSRKAQSGMRTDTLAARVLGRDDPRCLVLPENTSVGSVHLGQSLLKTGSGRSRGTSVCEEELVAAAVRLIRAGVCVELIGSDGVNYYRVGRNVFGATLKPGGGIDFFPVSGPDVVFLGGDRNKEAAEFIAKVIKRNGSPISEAELARWATSSKFTSQELALLQRIIGGG